MKKRLIAIIITVCVILLFVGTYFLQRQQRKIPENSASAVGNSAGNLYNGGMFCESDGYVYFSNPYDNYALYRMLPDETQMEKLISTQTRSINAAGKYFYYYQFGSGNGEGFGYVIDITGVYRAEKENPMKSYCLERVHMDNLLLAGNYLYYDANYKTGICLKKLHINGKESKTLLDYKVTPACAQNGTVYFNDTKNDYHLNALSVATDQTRDILGEDVYMPIVDGNQVFYIDIHNQYALVSYDLTTQTKTVLDEARTDMFNLTEHHVYYQTSGETPQFKRVSRDGSSMEVISDGAYNTINITSQYVYFKQYNSELPVYKIPVNSTQPTITTFDTAMQAAAENMK